MTLVLPIYCISAFFLPTAEELSYEEVKERLNLQDDDVMRCLHSLSCGKYKILLKSPEGRLINRNDKFHVNMKFKDRMFRIKVPLPPVDERRKVVEDVDKDRRYAIDAAIVRTMKSRKKLHHQQVISQAYCVEDCSIPCTLN